MTERGSLIFLVVFLAALLPLLVLMALPFVGSFILAAMIAVVVNPVKVRLAAAIRRPGLASLLTTLGTVILLGAFLSWLGYLLSQELLAIYNSLTQLSVEEGGWMALITHTADRAIDAVATRVPIDKEAIRSQLLEGLKNVAGYLVSNVGAAFGSLTGAVITALLVTFFLYFLLKYGKEWVVRLAALTPLDSRTTAHIVETVHKSMVANVTGVFAVAAAQGALLILGFSIIGLPSPVLWGVLGGVASIVPLIGAPLVWVPVMIGEFVLGSYGRGLFLALWGGLVVGSVDNVLRSLVVGASEQQHPMIVALAAIGGAFAFGALGILLGPLVVSLAIAVIEEIQELMQRRNA